MRSAGLGPWLALWLEALEPLAPVLSAVLRGGQALFPELIAEDWLRWVEDDTSRARWRAFWWGEA